MFDYLVAENIDKLRSDFKDMKIDPDPNSADMMFIKELIYGGPILPNEVLHIHALYNFIYGYSYL